MGMFAGNQSNTERLVQNIMPTAGTVKNLSVFVETAPGAGNSWVFTLRRGTPGGATSNTAVTCTISGTSQTCSDTTDTATYAAGDLVSVAITVGAGNPTGSGGQWTAVFAP